MADAGTLTRADLAETINRKMGFSRAESLDMVEAILDKMSDALSRGENVKISGFGSFVLEHLANCGGLDTGLKVRVMTLPDIFQDQDTPAAMYDQAGLTARHIAARAIEALGRGDLSAIERLASA